MTKERGTQIIAQCIFVFYLPSRISFVDFNTFVSYVLIKLLHYCAEEHYNIVQHAKKYSAFPPAHALGVFLVRFCEAELLQWRSHIAASCCKRPGSKNNSGDDRTIKYFSASPEISYL
jgi:predicted DNA-binding transcriptional regulator AlpA